MSTPPQQEELTDRIRAAFTGGSSVREVRMFGGPAFMVNEKMVVSTFKNGDLLVRVPSDAHPRLTQRPGARQAEMGAGRSMGPGWITASAASTATDEGLGFWLDIALDYNETVTG